MSGMRLGMDLSMRPDLKQVLAPRMIQSMEILQLPIADLQAKIEKELQENPFLELKEKHGEQDDAPAEFNPDSTPLKHDETGDLEFNRLDELNRDWDDHFNEEHRVSRAALDEEGDRKLDAMANMAEPPAVAPGLPGRATRRAGTRPTTSGKLARHICTFIDRTGYLGTRLKIKKDSARKEKEGEEPDPEREYEVFRPVPLDRDRAAVRRSSSPPRRSRTRSSTSSRSSTRRASAPAT